MRTNELTTVVPGVVCIGGVFFFHFGILASVLLYNTGLLAGIANSMLPLLKNKATVSYQKLPTAINQSNNSSSHESAISPRMTPIALI